MIGLSKMGLNMDDYHKKWSTICELLAAPNFDP